MKRVRIRAPEINVIRQCILLAVAFVALPPAYAQTPAEDGQWSKPFALPLIAIHSAMLPTGKVLLFSAEHGVPGIHGWVLDPESLALTNVPPPDGWNPDCAGHSFLPNGDLLVAGGTLQFNPLLGSKRSYVFDPYDEQWNRIEDMRNGRWYPTNVTLPDGRVLTMSGLNDTDGELNPEIEVWDPNGNANWEWLGQKTIPFYPYLHLMPSGLIFRSGPDPQTETYDPTTGQWVAVDVANFPGRYEAPSVLLPPTLNRVMLIGGFTGSGQPTHSAEIIDFTDASPAWQATTPMTFSRMEHNAVLLPDGQVFVVGGVSNNAPTPDSVLIPEIFDPATELWEQVAPHQIPRPYHATAILLPDGRVLVAGSDFQPSGEIYSPPYLFRGPRPTIQSAPVVLAYDTSFSFGFTSSTNSNTVVLIRLSSVTHSINMDQRYVRLAEFSSGDGAVSVPAPSNANHAPPGFYMLFVVDGNGVPSVSRIVRVITQFGDMDGDGDMDLGDFSQFVGCLTGPGGGVPPECTIADFDGDGDVDLADFGNFQQDYTGA